MASVFNFKRICVITVYSFEFEPVSFSSYIDLKLIHPVLNSLNLLFSILFITYNWISPVSNFALRSEGKKDKFFPEYSIYVTQIWQIPGEPDVKIVPRQVLIVPKRVASVFHVICVIIYVTQIWQIPGEPDVKIVPRQVLIVPKRVASVFHVICVIISVTDMADPRRAWCEDRTPRSSDRPRTCGICVPCYMCKYLCPILPKSVASVFHVICVISLTDMADTRRAWCEDCILRCSDRP